MSRISNHWLNWLTIWFAPRNTIRRVISTHSTFTIWLLIVASGAFELDNILTRTDSTVNTHNLPVIFALIFGPFLAVAVVHVATFILQIMSTQFGGVAKTTSVRAAIAWSLVPYLGIQLFMLTGQLDFPKAIVFWPALTLSSYDCLQIASALWGLLILSHMLSEIQGFSFSKAIACITLPMIIPGILAFFLPVMLLAGWFHHSRKSRSRASATVNSNYRRHTL